MLVAETLAALSRAGCVLDCTLGGGGHALALLEAGKLVTGLDRDRDAIAAAEARLQRFTLEGRLHAAQGDFTRLSDVHELDGLHCDGILADLGVSSWQLDEDARGFSFRPGVAMDMRMSGEGQTAADLLNHGTSQQLEQTFREYGDEPRARRLAGEVARRRERRPFEVSDDFVDAIRGALGAATGPGDFARLFQALRIRVNDELAGLERALPELRDRLSDGGVLVVIAYHSGEDRLVKHAMRDWSTACHCPPRQPICICGGVAMGTTLTRKAVRADAEEIAFNPRSRSARMRVWRKNS
ncbi:MAG: 16S rRNA (cytosine(1402)-N(4))-methyltransferase RsmH [Gemmatimonadaceae bacterium]